MATRGWENFTQTDVTRHQLKQHMTAKPSKYKNVKTIVNGEQLDSKREAAAWIRLKAQQELGDIRNLRRQVSYPLYCPDCTVAPSLGPHSNYQVAVYLADFVYEDFQGITHVIDVKGGKATRTQVYMLKRKWLELQNGITIEEI